MRVQKLLEKHDMQNLVSISIFSGRNLGRSNCGMRERKHYIWLNSLYLNCLGKILYTSHNISLFNLPLIYPFIWHTSHLTDNYIQYQKNASIYLLMLILLCRCDLLKQLCRGCHYLYAILNVYTVQMKH